LSIHKERLNLLQSQSSQHWGMPMTVLFIYLARHCKLFIALAFLWHFLSLAYAWMMNPKLFFMVVAGCIIFITSCVLWLYSGVI
jgi:hypothetical protein